MNNIIDALKLVETGLDSVPFSMAGGNGYPGITHSVLVWFGRRYIIRKFSVTAIDVKINFIFLLTDKVYDANMKVLSLKYKREIL